MFNMNTCVKGDVLIMADGGEATYLGKSNRFHSYPHDIKYADESLGLGSRTNNGKSHSSDSGGDIVSKKENKMSNDEFIKYVKEEANRRNVSLMVNMKYDGSKTYSVICDMVNANATITPKYNDKLIIGNSINRGTDPIIQFLCDKEVTNELLEALSKTYKDTNYNDIAVLSKLLLEERAKIKLWDKAPNTAKQANVSFMTQIGNSVFCTSQVFYRDIPKTKEQILAEEITDLITPEYNKGDLYNTIYNKILEAKGDSK